MSRHLEQTKHSYRNVPQVISVNDDVHNIFIPASAPTSLGDAIALAVLRDAGGWLAAPCMPCQYLPLSCLAVPLADGQFAKQ